MIKQECVHKIVWMKKWFGIFPKRKEGICTICHKEFFMTNGKITEKEVKDERETE